MIGIKSFVCALGLSALVDAQITLGTASQYGAFAATTITNTGLTIINARIGLNPGTSITGFPPGVDNGEDVNNAAAIQAKADIQTAFTAIFALPVTTDLTGQDLGGLTLFPGVYNFASSGGLTGILTLDAQGDPTAQFVFRFGSTITTATASSVVLINGAAPCNVFWGVGSSATLGTATAFQGNVIAQASITATTGVSVGQGGLYALAAAVTLDTNNIDAPGSCAAAVVVIVPIPTSTIAAAPAPTPDPITVTQTIIQQGATITQVTTQQNTVTTTAPGATDTVTSTSTVTNPASTTTIYITSTSTVTITTYGTKTATATVTATTTVNAISTTTKTLAASACTTSKKAKMAKRSAKKTKTVTSTCAGKTSTVKPANKTTTVAATHTSTSTHWVTKKATSTSTSTKQPSCTTKAKRDYQRMFQ